MAAKSLVCSIWDHLQDESYDRKIAEYVEAIRANADEADPLHLPDPLAFISIFTEVLFWLVPKDIVPGHEDEICGVMDGLVDMIVALDDSSW